VALLPALGKPVFLVDALIIQANANLALGEKGAGHALLEEALALGKVSGSEEDKVRALSAWRLRVRSLVKTSMPRRGQKDGR
jgi:hypothetical protein